MEAHKAIDQAQQKLAIMQSERQKLYGTSTPFNDKEYVEFESNEKIDELLSCSEVSQGTEGWDGVYNVDETSGQSPRDTEDMKAILGEANFKSDEEIVVLLKKKPKDTPQLKSKSSFQRYFAGVARERMQRLLHAAFVDYESNESKEEGEKKVKKRLSILEDVLID